MAPGRATHVALTMSPTHFVLFVCLLLSQHILVIPGDPMGVTVHAPALQ